MKNQKRIVVVAPDSVIMDFAIRVFSEFVRNPEWLADNDTMCDLPERTKADEEVHRNSKGTQKPQPRPTQ